MVSDYKAESRYEKVEFNSTLHNSATTVKMWCPPDFICNTHMVKPCYSGALCILCVLKEDREGPDKAYLQVAIQPLHNRAN